MSTVYNMLKLTSYKFTLFAASNHKRLKYFTIPEKKNMVNWFPYPLISKSVNFEDLLFGFCCCNCVHLKQKAIIFFVFLDGYNNSLQIKNHKLIDKYFFFFFLWKSVQTYFRTLKEILLNNVIGNNLPHNIKWICF